MTTAAASHEDAAPNRDHEIESILTSFDSNYVWNYGCVKEGLRDLYEKAKREQWNSTTQLDWALAVDPEADIVPPQFDPLSEFGPARKLSERERTRLGRAQIANQLSQFLHGEQGALIVASQLVGGVPWIDGKYYAASQTMDEARHVEVFSRYVNEKLEWEWPISDSLKELLDATITDSRWDFKFLGMQIIIEGLAMAAFGSLWRAANEPLLKQLLHYVMKDESRHVAFGMLALRDHYRGLSAGELRDRGFHHLRLRADARSPGRCRDRPCHGLGHRGRPAGRDDVADRTALPLDAFHADRAESSPPRAHHTPGAGLLRAPRDHPIRASRSRAAGPRARSGLTAVRPSTAILA